MNLSHISQVNNFVDLLILLLKPLHNNHQAFITYKLLYPPDLGDGHRPQDHIGIWPYMEYLLVEVFGKSTQVDEKFRILLQLKLVKLETTTSARSSTPRMRHWIFNSLRNFTIRLQFFITPMKTALRDLCSLSLTLVLKDLIALQSQKLWLKTV